MSQDRQGVTGGRNGGFPHLLQGSVREAIQKKKNNFNLEVQKGPKRPPPLILDTSEVTLA